MSVARVAMIFGRILQLPNVDENADFFELGGDSLLATRVLSAIARGFDVELSFEDFVETPSPQALYDRITAASKVADQCV